MDWEKFKRDTAHLNKARTEQERLQLFKSEATRSWRNSRIDFKRIVRSPDKTSSPASLKTITANFVKKQMYIKSYVDLVDHITEGEGIFPKIWDDHATLLKETLIGVRQYREPQDIVDWVNKHEGERDFEKEFQKMSMK